MSVYDPPLPREYPQCRICDCYLEQDWFGQLYCPHCCEDDSDLADYEYLDDLDDEGCDDE